MHADTEKLLALWKREVARDTLLAEWRGLHDGHKDLQAKTVASGEASAAAQAHLDELKSKERELNRKLESYQKRRDNAQRTIDQGTATDFAAAESQVAQCAQIADDVETELLELMDAIDEATDAAKAAADGLDHMTHRTQAAKTALDTRLPPLKAEFEAATQVRDAAREGIWKDQLSRYDVLRKKKFQCFATVTDSTCGGCHTKLDGLRYSNLLRDIEVVTCRHCGRFLMVPEEG